MKTFLNKNSLQKRWETQQDCKSNEQVVIQFSVMTFNFLDNLCSQSHLDTFQKKVKAFKNNKGVLLVYFML